MKVTYNDVYNLLMSANKAKQYLVYSYRKQSLPKPSSKNVYKGKPVYLCWVDKSDKSNVALMVLPATATVDLINNCIAARTNRGKTKYIPVLYQDLQEGIRKFRVSSKEVTFKEPKLVLTKEEISELDVNLRKLGKKNSMHISLGKHFLSKESPKVLTLDLFLDFSQFTKIKDLNLNFIHNYTKSYFDNDGNTVSINLLDKETKEDLFNHLEFILGKLLKEGETGEAFVISDAYLKTLETEHVKLLLTAEKDALNFFNVPEDEPILIYIVDFKDKQKNLTAVRDYKKYSCYFAFFDDYTAIGVQLPTFLTEDYFDDLTSEINSIVDTYYEILAENKEKNSGIKQPKAMKNYNPSVESVTVPTKQKEITHDVLDQIDELFPDDY